MGFVDLHAHYLPGIDDGAANLERALLMVEAVSSLGFTVLNATPHQRAGVFLPSAEQIGAAHDTLARQMEATFPEVTLGLGAENYWDDVFLTRLGAEGLPLYRGTQSFLFELPPPILPPRFEQTLFEIRLSGRLPVMAHPERYAAIQNDLDRAEAFGRSAALVVDLAALDGAHGRQEMKTARRLLEADLAHAAATDIHAPEDQRAIAAGMAWIRKRLGEPALERLLDENPRRILAGDLF